MIYRACEQRLKMRKWEIARYTLSQVLRALERTDPDDPHAGNLPISAIGEIEAQWARAFGDD